MRAERVADYLAGVVGQWHDRLPVGAYDEAPTALAGHREQRRERHRPQPHDVTHVSYLSERAGRAENVAEQLYDVAVDLRRNWSAYAPPWLSAAAETHMATFRDVMDRKDRALPAGPMASL